jgi:hypothetical protein
VAGGQHRAGVGVAGGDGRASAVGRKGSGHRLVRAHGDDACPGARAAAARPAREARPRLSRPGQRHHRASRIAIRASPRAADPRARHAPRPGPRQPHRQGSRGFWRTRSITAANGTRPPRARDTGNCNKKTASRKAGNCHKSCDMRALECFEAFAIEVNGHLRPRPMRGTVELDRQFAASDARLVRRQDDQGRRRGGTLGRLNVRWGRLRRPRGAPQCGRACSHRGEDEKEAGRQRAESDGVR